MGVQGRASSRGLPGRRIQLQQQLQGASDGFDISLTTSSSAGDEQQTYESDEIRHQVYHQRDCLHKQQQQQQYLSSDTEIPSIPSTSGERQQQAAASSDPSSFIRQAEQHKHEQMRTKSSSSQHQQKHRQLQAHIHQQLQRIYGDRSHQHQHPQQDQKLQSRPSQRRKQMIHSQDEQFSSHDSHLFNQQPTNQLSSSSEQTYDSLSSPNFTPPTTKQQQAHFIECRRRINAIPEEADQQQQHAGVDDLLLSDEVDEDHHHHDNQQHQRRLVESRETQTTRKQTETIVRESQLESLHYATATAAALLSATANAAAAIAATTDQRFMQHQPLIWPQNKKQAPSSKVELIKELGQDNSKYAHPYQEVTSSAKRREHECCRHTREGEQAAAALRKMDCIHQQQQQQLMMMMMKQNQKRLYAEPPPLPTTATYHGAQSSCHPRPSAHQQQLKHRQLYQQHQQALIRAKQMHHHHQALLNRPIPPQPPARGAKVMMLPGVAMPRQQQEPLRYIQPPPRPQPMLPSALAVVHTGAPSKAASAKADLIGRMLINNMVAAQRAATESHYGLKGRNDPYQLVLSPIREKLYTTQQQQVLSAQAQVYGPPNRMPVGRAASDSSGHSSAPLVVNRDLAPMTFIERLCRIDLTLFWWSLLVISFLFVGIIVTISRYVL